MLYSENIKITGKGINFTDKNGIVLTPSTAMDKAINRVGNWKQDLLLAIIHFISEHVPFSYLRSTAFKLSGLVLGTGSTIHMGVRFFFPAGIRIGEDSKIGFSSFLDGRAPLVIGNHVDIASEVMIYNSEHDLNSPEFTAKLEPVKIGDYVFIGPRAIILPGINLGKGSVVAAGAVVTKDVPEFSIVAGVPARVIGERPLKNLTYKLGRSRLFQ